MDSDHQCDLCNTAIDIRDPLRTPLELPCDHDICANCYVTRDTQNAPAIECLVCGERSKFKKGYQAMLNAAKQVGSEEILYCQKHRGEAIRYIC